VVDENFASDMVEPAADIVTGNVVVLKRGLRWREAWIPEHLEGYD